MAHEVIKKVGRRAYRYRVESYRDPETKKVRSRWQYLGVAQDGETAPQTPSEGTDAVVQRKPRRASGDTRERLVTAFLALVESGSYDAVTAGMVAAKAGLAHGTFYRYFRDKRAALMAALDRVREEFERDRPTFDAPFGDLAAERARVGAWTTGLLSKPAQHAGMLRAFYDALEDDPELQAMRRGRRAARIAGLAGYFEKLVAARIVALEDPVALASALTALVDGVLRESVFAGIALEKATVSGVVDVFDRAIFMAAEGSSSATDRRDVSISK
jgi:AcrR family transcriptional regulator